MPSASAAAYQEYLLLTARAAAHNTQPLSLPLSSMTPHNIPMHGAPSGPSGPDVPQRGDLSPSGTSVLDVGGRLDTSPLLVFDRDATHQTVVTSSIADLAGAMPLSTSPLPHARGDVSSTVSSVHTPLTLT